MKNSVINIESVENNSFGTGFVIDSDDRGVYILTCQHVLDDVKKPVVENVLAKIIARGNFIDMAVLYVSKLHLKPIPLQIKECSSLDVEVIGFSHFSKSLNQKKHIKATLYQESIELHATDDDLFYTVRKIKANDGFNFDRGNSGSPVICKESGKVIAMISNKEGDNIGYAIDIINLKDVWKDMPTNLLEEKIEQISGTREDITPKTSQVTPKNKSSILKYIFLTIISGAIFLGTYLFMSNKQSHNQNNNYTKPTDHSFIDKEEEQRKLAEQKRQEEQKRLAEQKKQEEQKRLAEQKKQEEQKRLEEQKERYEEAERLEIKAFEYLINKKYKEAIRAFEKTDNLSHPFHQSKEIAKLLSKNLNSMNNFKTKRKVLQTIINQLSKDAPPNLVKKLKKQLKLPTLHIPDGLILKPIIDLNATKHIKPTRRLDIHRIEVIKRNELREVH